jgi:hypothetical protein
MLFFVCLLLDASNQQKVYQDKWLVLVIASLYRMCVNSTHIFFIHCIPQVKVSYPIAPLFLYIKYGAVPCPPAAVHYVQLLADPKELVHGSFSNREAMYVSVCDVECPRPRETFHLNWSACRRDACI